MLKQHFQSVKWKWFHIQEELKPATWSKAGNQPSFPAKNKGKSHING